LDKDDLTAHQIRACVADYATEAVHALVGAAIMCRIFISPDNNFFLPERGSAKTQPSYCEIGTLWFSNRVLMPLTEIDNLECLLHVSVCSEHELLFIFSKTLLFCPKRELDSGNDYNWDILSVPTNQIIIRVVTDCCAWSVRTHLCFPRRP